MRAASCDQDRHYALWHLADPIVVRARNQIPCPIVSRVEALATVHFKHTVYVQVHMVWTDDQHPYSKRLKRTLTTDVEHTYPSPPPFVLPVLPEVKNLVKGSLSKWLEAAGLIEISISWPRRHPVQRTWPQRGYLISAHVRNSDGQVKERLILNECVQSQRCYSVSRILHCDLLDISSHFASCGCQRCVLPEIFGS